MELEVQDVDAEIARKIAEWQYDSPYDFYNNEPSEDLIRELMQDDYYAVVNKSNELIGFFCTGKSAQVPIGIQYGAYGNGPIDLGLGMEPSLTGKGFGQGFLSFILSKVQESFGNTSVRLTVATFNLRAIRLYENFGFVKEMEFKTDSTEFNTMIKIPLFQKE